ncbi:hypothetical protein ACE1AT_06825 [Pelatocladus sp. BLCC-F211]|uniref:hypothetical protein n=1 Tax=Pelatocladus sp. BLCC-F211 TaxID=3342752 RepID=UPI0035B9BD7E
MNRIFTALAITSSLVLTQACASQVKSSQTSEISILNTNTIANANPHTDHNMENDHNQHSGHSSLEPVNAIAELKTPSKIIPKNPVYLAIDIKDKAGKPIANFDKFQEQLMHLIVVSDDLQSFQHIHPTYKGNGRFEIKTDFPYPSGYTLFSDYKVAGKSEQVSVLKTQIPGQSPTTPKIDLATNKTFGNTKVNLKLSQPTIKAGQEVHVIFNLQDTVSNQPPADLKPYLGERGHLVILKQSSPLTQADYIHAHAMKNTPKGEIHFMTSFPKPGKYKMWGQFNRNDKIVTADFWIDVQ